MKIIKKIAAIMLSVMMVLGMCSVVGAEGTTTSGEYNDSGTITITKAIDGQTYTIYRILKLESFSREDDRDKGNYAYKVEEGWENFVSGENIKDIYLKTDSSGYVTWVEGADKVKFTQEALKYAKTHSTDDGFYSDSTKAQGDEVTFTVVKLGYYLVDSSAGALCLLDTTDRAVTIQEKNGVPSVEKRVKSGTTYKEKNTASIGDKVEFKTTITAQPGAQNYVLHDKMNAGLTFDKNSIEIKLMKKGESTESPVQDTNYTVKTSGLESTNPCTFHIEFMQAFCDTLKADDKIIVTYSATLNEKAVIGTTTGNTNTTYLKYGDSNQTQDSTTTTYTFEIPVFKYTGTDTPLAGANFTLKKEGSSETVSLIPIETPEGKQGDFYRVAVTSEPGNSTVTTKNTGKFTIQGLDAGTYYLTETQQPAGYNKLKDPIQIKIDEAGVIKVVTNQEEEVTEVKVLNKSGSLLPSTGGMGTTLFYIFGAILVIGSGVVLITKKRMK